ncbi:unnamed protein product [Amaranthus hypochondriacus]
MENVSTSKNGLFETDLEMGGCCNYLELSEGEEIGNHRMKQLCTESCSDGGIKFEGRVTSSVAMTCGDNLEDAKLMVLERKVVEVEVPEKKVVKERSRAMSAKKPPKHPRQPRGLSLDSADQKLIRELHELAKLKRARVERMKALKKAKEAKVSSSKNQLVATLLTVLFCLVLLLQGISSRTSPVASIQGSPIPTAVPYSIISVQHDPISSASYVNKPGSKSPRLVEHSVGTEEQESRVVG